MFGDSKVFTRMFKPYFPILAFLFISSVQSLAQRDEQLLLELQTTYPFKGKYTLENTASYQTLLKKDGKWRSISTTPTFEMLLIRWIDLLSEVNLSYTNQQEGLNTFEISPMVGARFYLTQSKKVDTRFLMRYQQRNFINLETDDWSASNRTRLRGEVYVSINGPNLFTDKLWYAFADYEEFIVFDQQLEERYANRRRARIGIGYRFDYKHRLDLGFTLQNARDEINEEFTGTDNIIQLKYKLFFNPAKPAE
jgi:hypothetical protein